MGGFTFSPWEQLKFESFHFLLIDINTEILPNLHCQVNKKRRLRNKERRQDRADDEPNTGVEWWG